MTLSASGFMQSVPAPMNSNTAWGQRYAGELRRVATDHANNSARTLQTHLGPSELGVACDRQVVGKLTGQPVTNHVADPWPSIVGTAVHAWLAEAFAGANGRGVRWVPEQRVTPAGFPDHPGTADLYDAAEQAVVDHKVLGETSLARISGPDGPPRKYVAQLLLYAAGYTALGLPVRRVALAAWPRTRASLDGLYVWDRLVDRDAAALLEQVAADTERRKAIAELVRQGLVPIENVPTAPDDGECYFCPFYRPQSARDGGPGCAGTVASK